MQGGTIKSFILNLMGFILKLISIIALIWLSFMFIITLIGWAYDLKPIHVPWPARPLP